MAKIRTEEELLEMPLEEVMSLLPKEFVENKEKYIKRYGEVHYQPLINVAVVYETCNVRLNDGSFFLYSDERVIYMPNRYSLN